MLVFEKRGVGRPSWVRQKSFPAFYHENIADVEQRSVGSAHMNLLSASIYEPNLNNLRLHAETQRKKKAQEEGQPHGFKLKTD